MDKLYFCDGHSCDSKSKECCYMNDGMCTHTTDVRHSLSKQVSDFPPTRFVPLQTDEIIIEEFDNTNIFKQLANGNMLKIVKH